MVIKRYPSLRILFSWSPLVPQWWLRLHVQSLGLKLERLSWVNRSRAQHLCEMWEVTARGALCSNWETFNTFQRTLWPTLFYLSHWNAVAGMSPPTFTSFSKLFGLFWVLYISTYILNHFFFFFWYINKYPALLLIVTELNV